jgi:hypothetical protein
MYWDLVALAADVVSLMNGPGAGCIRPDDGTLLGPSTDLDWTADPERIGDDISSQKSIQS